MSTNINHHNETKNNKPPLKGVIAVIGCDGSGKSTLTADLLRHLQKQGPAQRRYLGIVSGEVGDKIKALPLIGVRLERYLAAKAFRAQDMKKKIPGTGTAIIMHLLSYWRALHLIKVMRLSRRGVKIIADRYPQAEIAGFRYDGPGVTATEDDSWLLRKLAAREQKLYQWMAQYKPALVIRLNIDVETAFSRKPDHDMNELKDKIAVMPQLNFNGAKICELDAKAPYDEVLAGALAAISQLEAAENS